MTDVEQLAELVYAIEVYIELLAMLVIVSSVLLAAGVYKNLNEQSQT